MGLEAAGAPRDVSQAHAGDKAWEEAPEGKLQFLARHKIVLAVVVGLALALRLTHLLEVMDTPFFQHLHTDPAKYHKWALAIVEGDWLGHSRPVFYLAPLYPYFLAVIYSVFGPSTLAACLVQVVLSAVSAGLTYHLGRQLFGPVTAALAGLLAACYGMFIFYSGLILGATLIIFLDLCMLVLLVSGVRRYAWWKWVGGGVFFGLSACARGNIILFWPFVVLGMAAGLGFRRWKKWLPACLLVALAFALTISPVTLHNWVVGDDFVPLTANAGANFFIGNNQSADGIYRRNARYQGRPMGLSVRDQQANFPEVAKRELERDDLDPSEISTFWIAKTFEEIGADFGRWLRLEVSKLVYLCNAYEIPNNRNYYFSKRFSLLLRLPLVTFGAVLPLGVAGMIVAARRWRAGAIPIGFFLAHAAALLALFVTARYRLVLVLVVLVYAAAMVEWLCRKVGSRRYLNVLLAAVLLAAGYAVVYRPVKGFSLRANWTNLANAYRDLGQPEEALENYDRAIAISPNYYFAYLAKGKVLARLGREAEAREVLEEALTLAERGNDQVYIRRIRAQLRKLNAP